MTTPQPAVVVYTQPNCMPCRATKRKLDQMGLEYTEVDVTSDPEALAFVRGLGHQAAPVVYLEDGTHWSGYKMDMILSIPDHAPAEPDRCECGSTDGPFDSDWEGGLICAECKASALELATEWWNQRQRPRISEQVAEFHDAFRVDRVSTPARIPNALAELRAELIREEFEELLEALGLVLIHEAGSDKARFMKLTGGLDLTAVADALGDIAYVVYGAADVFGLDLDAIVDEIHRSNMSKLGEDGKPLYREDGKVLKGPNYSAPNLAPIMCR